MGVRDTIRGSLLGRIHQDVCQLPEEIGTGATRDSINRHVCLYVSLQRNLYLSPDGYCSLRRYSIGQWRTSDCLANRTTAHRVRFDEELVIETFVVEKTVEQLYTPTS